MLLFLKTIFKFLSKSVLGIFGTIISMVFLSLALHWIIDKGINLSVSKFGFKKDKASQILKFILIFVVGLIVIATAKTLLKTFIH